MMKRIMLDGEYFGMGDDLRIFAEVVGLPLERFVFHPDDVAVEEAKTAEEQQAREALETLRTENVDAITTVLGVRRRLKLLEQALKLSKS